MGKHLLAKTLCAAALAATAGLAVGFPARGEDDIRKLVSVQSGKCLQPVNGSADGGAAIVQQTCNGSVAQQWTVQNFNKGFRT
jgi:Ricin-type beta-trefoil lectin domain-like